MTIKCQVKSIEPLACNTHKILLHPETPVSFQPGQYLLVVMGDKDKRPFSIASSPCRHQGELELHIGAAEENAYALEVVAAMRTALNNSTDIEIEAPNGDAWLQESDRPLLLIAGGTGFSYVRSMLDHCIAQNIEKPIYLYWGAKTECQLYALQELQQIAQEHLQVHFVPVVESAPADWKGKVGNVLNAVKEDFTSLEEFDIYIAGRFEMAGAAREQFVQQKSAKRERMFADAYAFI
jgi:aquacobalamin reductase/NAD(P)H-flavin reductase